MTWQQKVQNFEEERQLKNKDWVGENNKSVIDEQIKNHMRDFKQ
jgi:hypothetical protein